MDTKEYQKYIKKRRNVYFKEDKAYDFIYKQFEKLGFCEQPVDYFFKNTSSIIEILRNKSWEEFQKMEHKFTVEMLLSLYSEADVNKMSSSEAVAWFVENFPMHIYKLSLSNTQSRRSRAGKEFEAIIELVLMGAGIPIDTQASIGSKFFEDKGLGKMVDFASPSSVEYLLNKRNTVLISAKTTLRERWQEVAEEMGRTKAREMFLATLDETISKEVIENLNHDNIQVVTTETLKNEKYSDYNSVISFEELLVILADTNSKWDNYKYNKETREEISINIEKQLQKHSKHPFVVNYYSRYQKKFKK